MPRSRVRVPLSPPSKSGSVPGTSVTFYTEHFSPEGILGASNRAEFLVEEAQVLTVSFTRAQLNEILAPMMNRLTELVYHVVGRANLPMKGINLVVRTGGSSQIVAVRQLLEGLFPDKVTEHDPFTGVAGGLAIADYHGYRWG